MNGKDIDRARPERRDAAENRQRILNTALKLFEQNGVEQVSMNQIAAEAQIGPGTLYRRYYGGYYQNRYQICSDCRKGTGKLSSTSQPDVGCFMGAEWIFANRGFSGCQLSCHGA